MKMPRNATGIKNIKDLTLDSLISWILSLAYFIIFICLFVVLLARLVVIWVVIAFSPLLVLGFVMGDKFKITDSFGEVKIFKEFFMPVFISFPIVIGHVMLIA